MEKLWSFISGIFQLALFFIQRGKEFWHFFQKIKAYRSDHERMERLEKELQILRAESGEAKACLESYCEMVQSLHDEMQIMKDKLSYFERIDSRIEEMQRAMNEKFARLGAKLEEKK